MLLLTICHGLSPNLSSIDPCGQVGYFTNDVLFVDFSFFRQIPNIIFSYSNIIHLAELYLTQVFVFKTKTCLTKKKKEN